MTTGMGCSGSTKKIEPDLPIAFLTNYTSEKSLTDLYSTTNAALKFVSIQHIFVSSLIKLMFWKTTIVSAVKMLAKRIVYVGTNLLRKTRKLFLVDGHAESVLG